MVVVSTGVVVVSTGAVVVSSVPDVVWIVVEVSSFSKVETTTSGTVASEVERDVGGPGIRVATETVSEMNLFVRV